MNKAELVQAMADEAGLSKSDAEKHSTHLWKLSVENSARVEKYSWLDSVRLK